MAADIGNSLAPELMVGWKLLLGSALSYKTGIKNFCLVNTFCAFDILLSLN